MSSAVAATAATGRRPWWGRPPVLVGMAGAVALTAALIRFGGGGLTFRVDARPEPGTTFDWGYFWSLVPSFARALLVTVQATLAGFAVAVVLGFVLALGRRSPRRLVGWPTAMVIELIRSTPLLVQLFFLYYALPGFGVVLSPMTALVLGLGVHYGAYCSEGYRAGIDSIPRGQWEAATALNLSTATTWWRVVIPQAVPNVLPALGNFLVAGFKDAPLGYSIQVTGVLFFATTVNARSFDAGVEPYTLIGVGFLLVSIPSAWLIRRLENRLAYRRTD